jgi:hypothetical protein
MDLIKKYFQNKQYHISYILLKLYKEQYENTYTFKEMFLETISNIDSHFLTEQELKILFDYKKEIKVLLMCNWCSNKELCNIWNKMSKGDYKWNNIKIVWDEPCDYYCIINKPLNDQIYFDSKKTILFRMEPFMEKNINSWGEKWATNINKNEFKFFGSHDTEYNNNEWHISKTYNQLSNEKISKDTELSSIISTVLSDKYNDPGHIKRIDFVKFIEKKGLSVDVYGQNKFKWKNYKGSLPYHQKDDALMPYKYTFNCENHKIDNYYTEKIIDGILSECLVFYSGCPNIKNFIDPNAFVYLELEDFEKDYETIIKALKDDWWSIKLPYIKEAKQKILNELQFFPRLEKIINNELFQ